jgi:hypothetical protein
MEEDYNRPTSPATMNAIEYLSADTDGPHLRLYRAVVKEDI